MRNTTRTTTRGLTGWKRGLCGFLGLWLVATSPGCAAMTGMLTGAFTGAVDAPAQVYRYHRGEFDRHPELWVYNLLLFIPLGIAVGPLAGFAKGIGLDVQWLLNQLTYPKAFTTYKDESVWRPYTIHW